MRSQPAANQASDEKVDDLTQASIDAGRQNITLRRKFFYFITAAVGLVVVAGIAVIAAYFVSEWGEVHDAVLISWFSAEIVQTIGLAYIVAKYLFSRDSDPAEARRERSRD